MTNTKGSVMNIFRYFSIILAISTLSLYSVDFSKIDSSQPLLSHSSVYLDTTRKINIETIDKQSFTPIGENSIGFGYAPDFNVWVKIKLHNSYNEKMKEIIEYANPLTTNIQLYDAGTKQLLFTGGTSASSPLKSINPAFPITLLP